MSTFSPLGCLLVGGLLAAGCSRSPEPDPCAGLTAPVSTPFKILNQVGDASFDCDTIFPGSVIFEASDKYDSYSWKVGNDPTGFTQRRFLLKFPDPTSLTVTLLAHRTPQAACFPKDTGVDTLRRTLVVLPDPTSVRYPRLAVVGKYQGATTDAPTDTFTIQVRPGPDPFDQGRQVMQLLNLNKGCTLPAIPASVTYGYEGFDFVQKYPGASCHFVSGGGWLNLADHNQLRLEYVEAADGSAARRSKVFIGKRIR